MNDTEVCLYVNTYQIALEKCGHRDKGGAYKLNKPVWSVASLIVDGGGKALPPPQFSERRSGSEMSLINQIAISNCSQERKDRATRFIMAHTRPTVVTWHQGQRQEIKQKMDKLANSCTPWLALRVRCFEEMWTIS